MGDILKGKVAIVTGSGQGIGRAIAITMGKEGARIITNNRKPGATQFAILKEDQLNALSPEKKEWVLKTSKEYSGDAETTAQKIREAGGESEPFFGDVSNFETASQLVQKAVDTYGKLDILVNVAGTFRFSAIWEMTEETWDYVNNVKPKGYFNCIRHACPLMMKQKWGRIINCTSQSWAGDVLKHAEYAAANAGVVGLTRAVASELYSYGITCNAFAPFARTRASLELAAYDMAVEESKRPYVVENKLLFETTPSPEDIGPLIAYLASDAAAHISGSVFGVGGSTVGLYADPEMTKSLIKYGGPWTAEELVNQMPQLLAGYQTHVASLRTFKDAGRS